MRRERKSNKAPKWALRHPNMRIPRKRDRNIIPVHPASPVMLIDTFYSPYLTTYFDEMLATQKLIRCQCISADQLLARCPGIRETICNRPAMHTIPQESNGKAMKQ